MAIERRHVAALSASAALVVSLWVAEGYTDKAIIPVKGDVPTYGFGMTERADGTPVQLGDRTTPTEALQRSLAHVQRDENNLKKCVTVPLSQTEYDLMVDFAYQYGIRRLCNSSMVAKANAGDYAASCKGYLNYKKVGLTDCSLPANKTVCGGVWTRSVNRYNKCMGAQ